MWFKNLALFRFSEPFGASGDELENLLAALSFRSCGSLELSTIGWVPPMHPGGDQLVHAAHGFLMICALKEEKILPPAAVNEIVAERIAEIEERQQRRVRRKERQSLHDEVTFELLPRALSFSRRTYAYIDPKGGWLVVDSGSSGTTDEFTALLRRSLGSLPIKPPKTRENPASVLTRWLSEKTTPLDITLENECDLRAGDQEKNIVRCKGQDLFSREIQAHLDAGKECVKMALTWAERFTFTVDEDLNIKRLRFLDLIQEQAEEIDTRGKADLFDAHFAIMSLELAGFLPRFLELFGGEATQNG
ncbi:MAG: recombination-associated protein RdgC [Methylococcaceae bacterium]|nr:recombination-associated protein RdgC [Methylococcaceae bacterium]MCI0733238.1 recombination-associated protein RdgC [Methylococcaceae bacterium]